MKRILLLLLVGVMLIGVAHATVFYSWGVAVTTTGAVTTDRVIITGCSFTSTAATAKFVAYDGTGATASTGTFVFGLNITAANTYDNANFGDGLTLQNGLYVEVVPSGTGAIHFKQR